MRVAPDTTDWHPINCNLCKRSHTPGVTSALALYRLDPRTITTAEDWSRLEHALYDPHVLIVCDECLRRLGGRLHEPAGDFVICEDTVQKLIDPKAKHTNA